QLQTGDFAALVESLKQGFEDIEVKSVGVHRYAEYADAFAGQHAVVDEVGRRLGDDDVAGVEQHFAEQIEQLLRAGGDDHFFGAEVQFGRADPIGGADMGKDFFAQRRMSLRGAILAGGTSSGRMGEQVGGSVSDFLKRQGGLVYQAGGETDEARRFQGESDQCTDG